MTTNRMTLEEKESVEYWFAESQEYQVWDKDGKFLLDFGYPEQAKAYARERPGCIVVSKHWTSNWVSDRQVWCEEHWKRLLDSLAGYACDYFGGNPGNVKKYFTVREKSFERPPAERFDDLAEAEAYASLDSHRYMEAVVVGQVWPLPRT